MTNYWLAIFLGWIFVMAILVSCIFASVEDAETYYQRMEEHQTNVR